MEKKKKSTFSSPRSFINDGVWAYCPLELLLLWWKISFVWFMWRLNRFVGESGLKHPSSSSLHCLSFDNLFTVFCFSFLFFFFFFFLLYMVLFMCFLDIPPDCSFHTPDET